MTFIFDLDGTLFNLEHRLHHIQQDPPNWDGFYDALSEDALIEEVAAVYRALKDAGHYIVIATGRPERVRYETVQKLHKNGLYFNSLYMRPDGDHREASAVKAEMLKYILQFESKEIHGVFEDSQSVVDMWRSKGLRVFQVAPGKF